MRVFLCLFAIPILYVAVRNSILNEERSVIKKVALCILAVVGFNGLIQLILFAIGKTGSVIFKLNKYSEYSVKYAALSLAIGTGCIIVELKLRHRSLQVECRKVKEKIQRGKILDKCMLFLQEVKPNNMAKLRLIMISSVLWGVFAHGMVLFNKYSFHDDAPLFLIGSTYSSGRWMLGLLGEWMLKFTGSSYYSVPLFKGGLTLLFIALACVLVSDLLEIESRWLNIGLAGIMTVFPTITGTLGYGFTAPYYLFGVLMGVFGVFLVCRYHRWYFYVGGVLLIACSVGVYQANIPVCISLLLIYMIKTILLKGGMEWKGFCLFALYYVSACVGSMALYFGINRWMLWSRQIEMTGYKNIRNFGQTSLGGYWKRCIYAYKFFFHPKKGTWYNMYPFSLDRFYKILLIIGIMLTVYLVCRAFGKKILFGIQALLLAFFLPLSCNFIFVICDASEAHALMMYGNVFVFVYVIFAVEYVKLQNEMVKRGMTKGLSIFLLILNLMYCRFDNICYLKAEVVQEQLISYYTTLITRIKSVEGYMDEMPVVYLNEYDKSDLTLAEIPELEIIHINPYYEYEGLINNYFWRITMKVWCGFDPVTRDASMYEQLPEVAEMPNYPDDGSIRVINEVVVVKF